MDAAAWDERYAGDGLVWSAGPNRWVEEALGDGPPPGAAPPTGPGAQDRASGRALDLGCGEGRNALWLAAQGWAATGVDFSAAALGRARRREAALAEAGRAGAPVAWVCADVVSWEPDPGAYGLVLVCYLHLPAQRRRAVLRAAARALAPDGRLLVVGHDAANLADGVGGPQDPAVLFAPGDVLADLGADGGTGADGGAAHLGPPALRVVRAATLRRPVQGSAVDALDAVVEVVRRG